MKRKYTLNDVGNLQVIGILKAKISADDTKIK